MTSKVVTCKRCGQQGRGALHASCSCPKGGHHCNVCGGDDGVRLVDGNVFCDSCVRRWRDLIAGWARALSWT